MKSFFNIVLVGAAGSGKGTQGNLLKDQMKLLQVSAGDVLRKHREENGKYTKIINEYIDNGQLVPGEITNDLMSEYIKKNMLCDDCKYNGVIFDGFPRSVEQLEFLDNFLGDLDNKIDAVVYINVPVESLIDRLSGRFSCSKCGEIYHKKAKPTKIDGICDKCGGKDFVIRDDDKDKEAIKNRFKIFEESTKLVLDICEKKGIVVKVDGTKDTKEVNNEILKKLESFKK